MELFGFLNVGNNASASLLQVMHKVEVTIQISILSGNQLVLSYELSLEFVPVASDVCREITIPISGLLSQVSSELNSDCHEMTVCCVVCKND